MGWGGSIGHLSDVRPAAKVRSDPRKGMQGCQESETDARHPWSGGHLWKPDPADAPFHFSSSAGNLFGFFLEAASHWVFWIFLLLHRNSVRDHNHRRNERLGFVAYL